MAATIGYPTNGLNPFQVLYGPPPSVALFPAAGNTASNSIVGCNFGGKITWTSGLLSLASGKIMGLTFSDGWTFPSGCFIAFTPGNAAFAGINDKIYTVDRLDGVDVYVSLALGINTTYVGYYNIVGY